MSLSIVLSIPSIDTWSNLASMSVFATVYVWQHDRAGPGAGAGQQMTRGKH